MAAPWDRSPFPRTSTANKAAATVGQRILFLRCAPVNAFELRHNLRPGRDQIRWLADSELASAPMTHGQTDHVVPGVRLWRRRIRQIEYGATRVSKLLEEIAVHAEVIERFPAEKDQSTGALSAG